MPAGTEPRPPSSRRPAPAGAPPGGGEAGSAQRRALEAVSARPRRRLTLRVVAKRVVWATAFWLTMRGLCLSQGYFQPTHYRREVAASAVAWPSRAFGTVCPLVHYLLFGYRAGLTPALRYDHTRAVGSFPFYNEVLSSPLEVYVLFGRLTGGEFFAPHPFPARTPALPHPGRDTALVVHAYHLAEFDRILDRILGVADAVDLIVTTSHPEAQIDELCRAKGLVPALVHQGPNRGRDVAPFCRLLNAGLLARYRVVGKLHTKRSAHRPDGGAWFQATLDSLLDPARLPAVQAALTGAGSWGLIAPPGRIASDPAQAADHRHMVALCARSGLASEVLDSYTFPHGTMFWARPAALQPLAALGLTTDAFEAEAGQLDGTLAHAVERMIGIYCARSGYRLGDMTELPDAAGHPDRRAGAVDA